MALIDEKINAWLKEKFLGSYDYYPQTQGAPEYITVVKADAGWECGCYSEFTRSDSFVMTATLKGANGREFEWRYGRWGNLPDFIQELDEYLYGDNCPYLEDDYS